MLIRQETIPPVWPLCLLLAAGLAWAGCARTDTLRQAAEVRITAAGNRELPDRQRLEIIESLLGQELDAADQQLFGEILHQVAPSNRHSPIIRRRAMQAIAEFYSRQAPVWLGEALVETTESDLRELMITTLTAAEDKRALPFLVVALAQAYDRGDPNAGRLLAAIAGIAGGGVEAVLWDYLAAPETWETSFPAQSSISPLQVRLAALACLHQKTTPSQLILGLQVLPDPDTFLVQLQFWASRYGYVPADGRQFLQCQWQRMKLSDDQLTQLHHRTQQLQEQNRYAFDCRDTYLLLHAEPSLLRWPRRKLTEQIAAELARLDHAGRAASYPRAPDDRSQDFAGQCNVLAYTDLLRIKLFLETLNVPRKLELLQEFLDQDLADQESEVGGLCYLENAQVLFKSFPPGERVSNHRFVESPSMIEDAFFCLGRWHCHALSPHADAFAGPGVDDLRYAADQNCPLIIVSLTTDNRFNVDYVAPAGVVIDLGNYQVN